ncbi:MAG: hypothetical protein IKG69_07100 [Atopobiaceae bacterium]|nr:hypothetical protein [Atopobiaceae bacterium]
MEQGPYNIAMKACRWVRRNPEAWERLLGLCEWFDHVRPSSRLRRGDLYNYAQQLGMSVTLCKEFRFDNNLWSALSRYVLMCRPNLSGIIHPRSSALDSIDHGRGLVRVRGRAAALRSHGLAAGRGGAGMTHSFTIEGRMPGLNEFIKAHDVSYKKGNAMKQRETDRAAWCAKAARLPRITCPVVVHFLWVEPNEKRDVDNVAFAKKFILDGLVRARIITNDDRRHLVGFTDTFATDRKRPRIEVTITEVAA